MASAARGRLAQILAGAAAPAASSVALTAKADDLRLEVEGVGRVRFPVPAEQARRLCQLGQPARFGRGEETLTDPEVRDTWEVPKNLVRIEWNGVLATVLSTVREQLGLASCCQLAADFHSMLVYEPGQFFAPHQDSEKDDTMIGSLVVVLPSAHTGGQLVVEHAGAAKTYRGSKSAISLVAFYADCRHEVRPVKSGYRVTLTYNLLVSGDTGRPAVGDDATVGELARCLTEHFTIRVTNPYSDAEADPPNRLVYLLDREYTARGLSWSRLKGTDASRASLLRAAADSSGCESVLALAEVQETWSAYDAADDEYGDWDDDYGEEDPGDEDRGNDKDSGEYDIQELIESNVRLTAWTGPAGTGLEDVSLHIDDTEACASTRSADLRPYASEYEGYMGNYGNTLDRWYRRAALVVWPRDRSFANRAEASPAWALDELSTRVRAGDVAGARAAAATMSGFWDTAVRAREESGSLGKALRVAAALDGAAVAGMLLRPFRVEDLTRAHAAPLTELTRHYGEEWVSGLLLGWADDKGAWAYAVRQNRPEWVVSLPGLCEALHAEGSPGTATAQRLLGLLWDWLRGEVSCGLAEPSPSRRHKHLGDLGPPLAGLLSACAVTGGAGLRDEVTGFVCTQGGEVVACVVPALRAAATLPHDPRCTAGFSDLAANCAAWLRARLAKPPRADDDWSISLPSGCSCELCDTLGTFLHDPARRVFEWPIAEQRRRHVHSRIDAAELPVRHQTRRQGRPYTLVLAKNPELFERERQARLRDEADLAWLTSEWELAR